MSESLSSISIGDHGMYLNVIRDDNMRRKSSVAEVASHMIQSVMY